MRRRRWACCQELSLTSTAARVATRGSLYDSVLRRFCINLGSSYGWLSVLRDLTLKSFPETVLRVIGAAPCAMPAQTSSFTDLN